MSTPTTVTHTHTNESYIVNQSKYRNQMVISTGVRLAALPVCVCMCADDVDDGVDDCDRRRRQCWLQMTTTMMTPWKCIRTHKHTRGKTIHSFPIKPTAAQTHTHPHMHTYTNWRRSTPDARTATNPDLAIRQCVIEFTESCAARRHSINRAAGSS